ncbi:MAG: tetratricopeptide repeat-containing sensor histidine kinase [Bacteroidia bacterium]|nr:tetratricopeptide repeat-containing sensor histidine kinase [Bacteroidia bacterium]
MKTKDLIVLIVFCFSLFSYAGVTDSLVKVLYSAKTDTTKARLCLEIGEKYEIINPDSAIYFYNQSLRLTKSPNFKSQIPNFKSQIPNPKSQILYAQALTSISWVYGNYFYRYDTAITLSNKALLIFNKLAKSDDKEFATKAHKGIAGCFNNIGNLYFFQNNFSQAIKYYQKSLKYFKKLGDSPDQATAKAGKKGMSRCFNNIGNLQYSQGSYPQAMEYYQKSLKIFEELGDQKAMSVCLFNIGIIYNCLGNYPLSIEYFQKSLKIREEHGDKLGICNCLNNIGNVHSDQKNYQQAIEYYQKSLKLVQSGSEGTGKKIEANLYNNIGNVYNYQENYSQALEYYQKSLIIKKELDDKKGMANCFGNIGYMHSYQGNYKQAIEYFKKSLKICEELGDKQGIAVVYNSIAVLNIKLKEYNKALGYAQKGLNIAVEIGTLINENSSYEALFTAYDSLKNTTKAYYYYKLYTQTKDSLFNTEKNKQITEMEAKYQSEKKQKEIELLNKEKQLQQTEMAKKQTEIKQQRTQKYAFIAGLAMVLVLTIVSYRSYRRKRKDNMLLERQNLEITMQKEEIESQRDEIVIQCDTVTQQKEQLAETLNTLRQTQTQLVESEKMASLGSLVAGVAHEINTPVGIGITASSSLVEDTKQFAELYKNQKMRRKDLEEYLENTYKTGKLIFNNMNRTGELVQSFKQVSIDQTTEKQRKFNLKSYLQDIIQSIKPEFKGKAIKVDIDCDENIEINSYPGVFAQIITNLALNSIRHGFRERDEGEIRITAHPPAPSQREGEQPNSLPFVEDLGGGLILQYSDNGCGISDENLPKIFDPFFTTNKQIGTGLGLHIVYNLVTQKLKGTVNCESREGVLFSVEIPI